MNQYVLCVCSSFFIPTLVELLSEKKQSPSILGAIFVLFLQVPPPPIVFSILSLWNSCYSDSECWFDSLSFFLVLCLFCFAFLDEVFPSHTLPARPLKCSFLASWMKSFMPRGILYFVFICFAQFYFVLSLFCCLLFLFILVSVFEAFLEIFDSLYT